MAYRHKGHELCRGLPRRLHPPEGRRARLRAGRAALHRSRTVHRLRRLRRGLPGRRDHARGHGSRRVAEVHRDQRSVLPRKGGLTIGPAPTERRPRHRRLESRRLFAGPAVVFALAAAAAAVVRSVQPFDHGWWLVAFLALVGGLSQVALGGGQRALTGCRVPTRPAGRVLVAELVLWNLGTVVVPVGVFAGAPAVVVVGAWLCWPRSHCSQPPRGRHQAEALTIIGRGSTRTGPSSSS
jgi:hypothetical protein